MNRWIRHLLLLSGICWALPAAASDLRTITCPVNQDRVWVYDSLSSFDVEAKLRCGETVEIVSRVKGYVKVRTASGLEGYLPDSVFPDLPPLDDSKDTLGNHNAGAPAETAANTPTSLAAAAAAYRPAPKPAPKPAPVVEPPATTGTVVAKAPKPAAPAPAASTSVTVSAPRPKVAPSAVATAAKPEVVVAMRVPAPQPSAPIVPARAPGGDHASAAALVRVESPAAAPSAVPAMSAPGAASLREAVAVRPVAVKPIATIPESEDYPDALPDNESADPQCRIFFSAYGLGATQYKWLSENRRKQFSSICPAPNLTSVDFVILFTHDSDSYISAMPTPVHTDGSGFSDFSPMTTVDTALMSPSDADKARYELAWVFRVKRGDFDPAKFSPRRRPQFSNVLKGSHASTRAVEDAFNFIEQQAPNR